MTRRHRVVVANVYRKNEHLDHARAVLVDTEADVLLVQEGQALGGLSGYQRHSGQRGHAREVAIYVRDDQHVLDEWNRQMSEDAGRAVSHARYAETIRLATGLSAMSTHMNADIKDHGRVKLRDPGTREWIRHMRRVMRWCRREIKAGRTPVVGMDSNFYVQRPQLSRPARLALWWWSPQRAFNRCGMTWHYHGMDGLAAPKGVNVALSTIAPGETGSDHRWVVADLTVRE